MRERPGLGMQGSSVSFGGFTLVLGCFGIFRCHTVVSIVSVRLFIDARLEACQGRMSGSPRSAKTDFFYFFQAQGKVRPGNYISSQGNSGKVREILPESQ